MRVISRLPPSSRRQLMATTQIEFAATALVRLPRRKMLANASRKPDTCPHKATRTRNAAPMAGDRPPKERRRAMPMIDLSFPLLGPLLPCDHGYELYAALSRILPALHHDELPCRIAPVRGTYAGDGLLHLDARYSRLRLRLALDTIPHVLPLAGKALEVGGHRVRLGVPQASALVSAPALAARLVTISIAHAARAPEVAEFLDAARRRLDALGIAGEAGIPLVETGPHAGKPRRRILRIRQRKVVGFAMRVTGLTAEQSIALQENGLGGRSKMGCGFFLPVKEG